MKKKITLTALTILMLILPTTLVQANYQSIPTGSAKTASADTWIIGIRQMESAGQVMGLKETIDTNISSGSSGGKSTSSSNKIDVHMLKNTEYGAIVLLGASNYGKQGSGSARYMNTGETTTTGTGIKASTTGNVSGVYEFGKNNEWVAGGTSDFLPNVYSRYVDRYTTNKTSAKVGDATVEGSVDFSKWHVTGLYNSSWVTDSYIAFIRGGTARAVFSRESGIGGAGYATRAAVVNGSGF